MPIWLNLSFQDGGSPLIEFLVYFHDHIIIILTIITILTLYRIIFSGFANFNERFLLEGHILELLWTFLPGIILIFIAFPSLKVLYLSEETFGDSLILKAVGHQWYWSYEFVNFEVLNFDRILLGLRRFRLLDCGDRLVLPFHLGARFLVTSEDVIHSWTIPSIGVKVDAVPGRLNQLSVFLNRSGCFFGQCSEICGANHSFIPISLELVSPKKFFRLISLKSLRLRPLNP
jgi:cytochrome c oxidase subunit 2